MTTANPSHARPSGLAQAWRSFRRWQRSRPFWGGLFTALAGVEMFASTRMTINGLSFHSGATGLLSLLIPIILVTCGVLLWLSPAQRLFYSVVAAVTTVYSLIGLNLGGFFVGLLLGLVGSALAFAWTPIRPVPPSEQVDSEQPDSEPLASEQVDAEQPGSEQGRTVDAGVDEPMERPTAEASSPPEGPGRSTDPRAFVVALVVLGLSATGLAVQPRPVQAAPGRPAATDCPTPSRPATPSPTRGTATPTASPTPQPSRSSGGNPITDFLKGIGDLLTGGHRTSTPTPSVSPTTKPSTQPTGTPTRPPANRPGTCPTPSRPGSPTPGKAEPGKLLPRIAADPNLPRVAQTPSKLTGSKVTMTGLRFDGITELESAKGSLKVLKFSMREAVTDDFLLQADGPEGRRQRYATNQLTVRGNVAFYATRFVGRLLGIKVTLTPDLPLPEGIPVTLPIPITFTEPAIDLAYVNSDTLTARPALALSLG
ncbi:DUF6114 domain-containing protein [Micromonospora sp. CPCC 205539]|uniref:DUF6114 domain-containing protein n=1 Tax=Micromonospora sp. CPCC 205539 TaxID=3122408 RepID=UPI002FF00576